MISLKHEIKSRIRQLTYTPFVQSFFCYIAVLYMRMVYVTSKKNFVNSENFKYGFDNNNPIILSFWHGRLMLAPFVTKNIKNKKRRNNFIVLSSKHGDGQLVSKVMSKFGFINVSGSSTSGNNKLGRGITNANIREILKSIKSGMNFAITPDGPRGPKCKIKGQVVSIAKISGAPILPFSYSSSKYIKLKSWDEFMIPLPFSTLCFFFGDLIYVDKKIGEEEIIKLDLELEEKMNLAMKKADEIVNFATKN